ncbi:DNRLRE domain-containing protein [Geobacillus sp. FSL W8-0032]|uniref:tRNA nuclease WapA n=2 Tax=Anoxybacillaceae TaxID=3120669 RepID=A0A679FR69_9BACL|nr:DNRLRE domain-containing protein [Geobacillus subterraneus]BBW97115.1 tRNA nuclease WapA [Geobacillus subterraneus]
MPKEEPPKVPEAPKRQHKPGEIVEMRTANTKVYDNGDGTFTKKIYFEPIHRKKKGEPLFEETSSNLTDSASDENGVETENTVLETTFYKKMFNGEYATFRYNGHFISYSILEASGNEVKPIKAKDAKAIYQKKDNKILHKNIFPSIDLQNITFNESTKEDLVLHSFTGYHIFKFRLKTDLQADIQDDGSILLTNKEHEKVFELPKPFMVDSHVDEHSGEAQRSENVSYELQKDDEGYILTVKADPEWLKDPKRVYPVYIDPSTSVQVSADAFVMSAYPTTNYSSSSSKWDSAQGQYVLKVGYYDGTTGTCYGFLHPDLSSIKYMNVTNATFHVYVTHSYYTTTPTGLWLDAVDSSWSASTLTWNNKPSSTNIGKVDVARDQWAQFDVTNTVKEWASETKPNYGFKLHTNGNGQTYWKKVVSTTNSSYKPYLSVTYTIPVPNTPTGTAYSNGDGTGYINLSWDPVPGATGYKVWIYNGKSYEAFNVGNVTSWSTKGKKIWPTASEISAGRYDLHQDQLGTELAVDPSPVYRNSGGSYPNSKNYWFRVSAIFPQGESAMSGAYMPTIPDLAKPSAPTGVSYTNGNGTGYIDFKWNPVSGATGYKIWIFNGSYYESLDVGNVTSWTTKNKKYWPTSTEIQAGRYKLHLNDGLGTELAVNPSPVYANAGTKYATATNYWIRVSAYNSQGETVFSDAYMPSIPNLRVPPAPSGFAYSNQLGSNSGYVMLDWEKISGATGYKVWIFNGLYYEAFDVGDVDHWTTQNKGIWPTPEEIQQGDSSTLTLHHDGQGLELPKDPSPMYAKMGTKYATSTNYYFRLSAYNADGETVFSSNALTVKIPEANEYLGKEDYWSIIDVPYGSVNAATGNLIIDEDDVSISGRGPGLGITRTYNSLSTSVGLFGKGWHSDAEMNIVAQGNEARFTDEDGTLHIFTKLSDGTYKAPTGVYLELSETTNEYILTTKDQTKIHFRKSDGKLTKIVDGHGNATIYSYSNEKLVSITDASGRKLSIEYNASGRIQKITAPMNRTITYEYNNDLLTKVTQTGGEVTRYEYDDRGRLVNVFEPTHTVEKPVVYQFVYDGDRLSQAIDPEHHAYALNYDPTKRQLVVTKPNGRKTQYTFNEAANPIQIVDDAGGLNITTNYVYEGNNLKESYDPNDAGTTTPTESYTYDANGNVLTATDRYGTETYQYNQHNNVVSIIDTENDKTTIAYDGLNPVSEIDQAAKTASFAKYDAYGNLMEESDALGSAANLIVNPSFEQGMTAWSLTSTYDAGQWWEDANVDHGLAGRKTLKMTVNSTSPGNELGYVAATQVISVKPNTTYTLSGKIKTNLTKANAFFNIEQLDSQNRRLAWVDNRYSSLSGIRPWTERQVTFTTHSDAAKVRVYLEVDHRSPTASGEAWFDQIQLEEAQVSSSYNPVANSSFEGSLTNWSGMGGSIDGTESFDGACSLKLTRTSTTQSASEYKQTVIVGQTSIDAPLRLTLTGLSKAQDVKANGTVSASDYSITAKVYFVDGTTQTYTADFPTSNQDWNRAAVSIQPSKPIDKIDISAVFRGNYTGTVWFDAIRLMEGNVVTKNKYDASGNYVTEEVDEEGYVAKKNYDAVGNLLSEYDKKGNKKEYTYDLSDRLKQLLLANGTSVNYDYDLNGNMTSKVIRTSGGQSQTFAYSYDATGKLIKTVGPLNDVTTNEYDANGNKIKTVLPKGNTIQWTYDGTERVKTISYNNVPYYEFSYDKNGNELSVQYLKDGTTKTRTFDQANRLVELSDRGGLQKWLYPTTSDKLQQFMFSHGSFSQTINYQYNKLDQNTVVQDGTYTYRFDYDERGNVRTFTTGNRAGSTFTYDDRGLVESVSVGTADGTEILSETYRYDENGNRTKVESPTGETTVYRYDALDQLVEEQLPDGTKIEYAYDGFGNRKQIVKTKDGQSTTTNADYNAANQLIRFGTETITYDANGNRLEDGKYQYEWNEADQLVSITRKGESTPFVTYKYDEDGRRIQKNVNGVVTNYHYQGDSLNVLYETDASGNVVRSYIYGENGQLLAMKKGTATYFYHYNVHGDVIALTDEQGNIVARYQYDAWGNILSQSGALADENPYRYAGYQYDQETGFYYLIARYYHPEHGVFLSMDPDPGDTDDILTQNGYAYANNNPVMLVDPDGKFAYAVGLYFVPGVGQVMLIGTAAVVGAYGAWYLGKKVKSLTSKGSLPLTGPRKGSLTLRDEKGKVIQRRYYDSAGRAKKDMDYSDHGNPKHHPWGPHRHKWKWDGKKPKRGKAEPMNKGRRK